MKTALLMLGALACCASAYGQKVCVVDREYRADVKVYVEDREYRADLLVYETDRPDRAAGNKGIWYFEDTDFRADKKIIFVDSPDRADLKICFVDREYQAGWKKSSKKHLMR